MTTSSPRAWYETLSTYRGIMVFKDVCACARYQVNPKVSHHHAVKRIFRDCNEKKLIQMVKIHTEKNVADLLTKAFDVSRFQYLIASIGMLNLKMLLVILNTAEFLLLIILNTVRKSKESVRLMMEKLFGMELELILVKVTAVKGKNYQWGSTVTCLVVGKKIIITKSTVRRDLQLEDAEGVDCFPNSTIFEQLALMGPKTTAWNEFSSTMASAIIYEAVHKELGDSLVRVATTASSLEAKQDSCNITKTRSKVTPNESSSLGTTSGGGPWCQETIGDTIAQTRFENVSKHSNDSLLARGNTLRSDEDRLKLEELMALVSVQDDADIEMFDVDALNGEEVFAAGQNENVVEEVKGIVFQEPCKSTTTTTISSQQSQDKGKGIMIEEPVKPMKKKDLIRLDEDVDLKLQAEFDEEERLAREKAEKEKEVNIDLIEEWDDIQTKIDADHQLAKRLQEQEQEELFDVEKTILF
ncbi:hypothetical protein Tco_0547830 [Tanacetum coccineum]